LEAAQALRIYGSTTFVPSEIQEQNKKRLLVSARNYKSRRILTGLRPAWWYGIFTLLFLVLLVIGVTLFLSSAVSALPGDALYPIKLAVERARLMMVNDPGQHLEIERANDQARLEELASLMALGRKEAITFTGSLVKKEPGAWQVGGIPVQVTNDTQIIGQVKEGISVQVNGFLQSDGQIKADEIRPRQFLITGPLYMSTPNLWHVGTIPVEVNGDTILHTLPEEGKTVRMSLFLTQDGKWLARLVEGV
jgi:hypothetical protein